MQASCHQGPNNETNLMPFDNRHVNTDSVVIVLCYMDAHHEVKERFLRFPPGMEATSDCVAGALLDRLSDREKNRCTNIRRCQCDEGEWAGVQQKGQERVRNVHYVHCYVHQLNLFSHSSSQSFPSLSRAGRSNFER